MLPPCYHPVKGISFVRATFHWSASNAFSLLTDSINNENNNNNNNKKKMNKKSNKNKNIILLNTPKAIDVEQQLLVSERDDLLEAEAAYKRRVEQLEEESAEMLRSFDILYNENRILRSKLDMPEDADSEKVESYNTVYKEREHFREANMAYKRRIKQLEDDAEDNKKGYEELEVKYQLLTQKAQLQTEYATKAKDDRIGELVEEQDELNKKVLMFIKEREQYEERISQMMEKEVELKNKCDFLENNRHEFQIRCEILQSDRETLKEKVTDLETQIPDPEIKAKEEQQYLGLQAQVVTLQVANKDASYEIHKLKEEIRTLHKTQKPKVETLDKASSALEAEEKLKNASEKTAELENDLEERMDIAVKILRENDKLKSDMAIAGSEIANLKLEVKQLQEEAKIKETTIDEMLVQVKGGQSLTTDYEIMQNKFKEYIAEKQVLENELLQEKRISKLKIVELNNEITKTADALRQKENAFSHSQQEAKRLQHENGTQQKVIDAQAIELRNMKAQLEQIQHILDEKSKKYEAMKKSEKEAVDEMKSSRLELHTVKRELEDLKNEKRGNFGILKKEMETAKSQRQEETEKLKKETTHLREEIKRLKESETKISIMETEINRLLLRLKRSEKFRKIPTKISSSTKTEGTVTVDREELFNLRKRQRELEKEKLALLQEKKQWEVLKEKYLELQLSTKRLSSENKRVRSNLDGSESKVELLEKRFKQLNAHTESVSKQDNAQVATYVDKDALVGKKHALVKKIPQITSKQQNMLPYQSPDNKQEAKSRKLKSILKWGKKSEKKVSPANPRTKHKMAVLPEVHANNVGLQYGKGYKDLHKIRYKPTTFKLGLL